MMQIGTKRRAEMLTRYGGGLIETSIEISALQRLQFLVNQEPNLALARNKYFNFQTPNTSLNAQGFDGGFCACFCTKGDSGTLSVTGFC